MKYIYSKLSIALLLFSFLIIPVTAQNNDDNDIDNGVISSAGRQGFSFQTKNKKFLFKPYALIQIAGKFNYYDDEGLNLADQDKIANVTMLLRFGMRSGQIRDLPYQMRS